MRFFCGNNVHDIVPLSYCGTAVRMTNLGPLLLLHKGVFLIVCHMHAFVHKSRFLHAKAQPVCDSAVC